MHSLVTLESQLTSSALGSKRNLISWLTGVSHEKLQVLHQGTAIIFTYMASVHTIAACIRDQSQLGFIETIKTDITTQNGFVAYAALLVLFIGFLPIFR